MKRFLVKISISAFLLFCIALGSDYIISKGLLQMEDYRFDCWRDMTAGNCDADILIMGNSRGLSHFDPAVIDSLTGLNSYCIGMGGYPFNMQMLKYRFYRAHSKKPQIIIQQIDYISLWHQNAKNEHESEQFMPEWWDETFRNDMTSDIGYSWMDKYIPLYRYFGYQQVIKNGLLEGLGLKHYNGIYTHAYKGHMVGDDPWDGSQLNQMDSINSAFEPECRMMLEDYMQKAYNEGVKVVLVNSPMYSGAVSRVKERDKINNYYDSIASRYHTVYLNYTEDYSMCNDTSNFSVSVHLRKKPVKQFTADFIKDLQQLGIVDTVKAMP